MLVNYNMEKLKEIMNDLSVVTGMNFEIDDTNFHFLYRCHDETPFCTKIQNTPLGANKCMCSDASLLDACRKSRSFQSHICHAGLKDSAIPIVKNDVIVGYIIMGPLRPSLTKKEIISKLSWMDEDIEEMVRLYKQIPQFKDLKLASLSNLLSHILFENAIEIDYNDFITFATTYIKANLSGDLSIANLCSVFGVSKNFIYKSFHEGRNCTVNEYINKQRIKEAQRLIRETDETMYKIAESVGIPNYTYFCRLYKKITGISPMVYRKEI